MTSLRDCFAKAIKEALFAQPTWQGTVDNGIVADALIQAWIDFNAEKWAKHPANRPLRGCDEVQ